MPGVASTHALACICNWTIRDHIGKSSWAPVTSVIMLAMLIMSVMLCIMLHIMLWPSLVSTAVARQAVGRGAPACQGQGGTNDACTLADRKATPNRKSLECTHVLSHDTFSTCSWLALRGAGEFTRGTVGARAPPHPARTLESTRATDARVGFVFLLCSFHLPGRHVGALSESPLLKQQPATAPSSQAAPAALACQC